MDANATRHIVEKPSIGLGSTGTSRIVYDVSDDGITVDKGEVLESDDGFVTAIDRGPGGPQGSVNVAAFTVSVPTGQTKFALVSAPFDKPAEDTERHGRGKDLWENVVVEAGKTRAVNVVEGKTGADKRALQEAYKAQIAIAASSFDATVQSSVFVNRKPVVAGQPDGNTADFIKSVDFLEFEDDGQGGKSSSNFQVTDVDKFLAYLDAEYQTPRIELGTNAASSPGPLNDVMKAKISTYVTDPNLNLRIKNGIPGLHADILSINETLNKMEAANIELSEANQNKIATAVGNIDRSLNKAPATYSACPNCSGIWNTGGYYNGPAKQDSDPNAT